jgi:hypothetical protein
MKHWPMQEQDGKWLAVDGIVVGEEDTSRDFNVIDCPDCKIAIGKWSKDQHSHVMHPLFEQRLQDKLPTTTPFVCPFDPGKDKDGQVNLGFHMPSMAAYMATCPDCRAGLRLSK